MGKGSDRLEIYIDDAIGLRQQAGGFRRGLGAQKDGEGQQSQHRADYQ